MATVALTPTQLSVDTAAVITQGAGTAIVAANTNTISYPKDGELLILIDSDHADTAATIAVSDYGVAKGQGTVTYSVADTVQSLFVVGSSSRFKIAAGDKISITWAANSAGYIRAYYLPKVIN